jgi:hypothetical protein
MFKVSGLTLILMTPLKWIKLYEMVEKLEVSIGRFKI